jgi:alpha-glucosidase
MKQTSVARAPSEAGRQTEWWHGGVLYHCYVRSFSDSDGDGIGDLRGVIDRLEHLAWLGVDGLWLSPVHPSPNHDWGYDVADYLDVHHELGTLEDLDRLIAGAAEHGIHVLLDLVPNHTSEHHAWFREAREDPSSPRRGYYLWRPGPPNNWVSMFGGPAWSRDPVSGQFYMHNFLPSQPDLNWWNPAVWAEFDAIMRFWLDRGVSGFRIDVAHGIVKDQELRDNPPADDEDRESWRLRGQKAIYSMNRPEVHAVHRHWRTLVDGYERPRALVGETLVHDLDQLAAFYGDGTDQLHLAFNFVFALSELDVDRLKWVVRETEARFPASACPAWLLSNHDMARFPTRWAGGDVALARALLVLLLTLRGTAVLYYGDEIGMPQSDVHEVRRRDPRPAARDGARTPMPWRRDGGFSRPGVEPWLPFGDAAYANVADQRSDPRSTLHLVRDLVELRRREPALAAGGYEQLDSPAGSWLFRRGRDVVVALNLGDTDAVIDVGDAMVLLSSPRGLEGCRVQGTMRLASHTAIVLRSAGPDA